MTKRNYAIAAAAALTFLLPAAYGAEPQYYATPQSKLPFSEAVRAGDFLYVSGQIGTSKDADPAAAFKAASHSAMDAISKILTAHGSSLDHVVQCTVMLADMKQWPTFNEVYATYFKPGHMPARNAFGVTALAFDAPVEVACFAYEPAAPGFHPAVQNPR
jgi:2-iminobutanoate/2-iminopropanoate deaminase